MPALLSSSQTQLHPYHDTLGVLSGAVGRGLRVGGRGCRDLEGRWDHGEMP